MKKKSNFMILRLMIILFSLPTLSILTGCHKDCLKEEDLDGYVKRTEFEVSNHQQFTELIDSLSNIYNVVELYNGISSGGTTAPAPFVGNSLDPWTGGNQYRTVNIPGGLKPGDKVFVAAEARLSRQSGSINNINVNAQSCVTITNSLNATTNSGTQYIAEAYSDTWDLSNSYFTIDRSGIYVQENDIWTEAYVNLYSRIVTSNNDVIYGVGGLKLSVIVVRD